MAHNYIIRVTAGPSRDVTSHTVVPVNTPEQVHISTDLIDARLNVRVQNHRGLPRNSPSTSPYFSAEPHRYNNDQYSIALGFRLKKLAGIPAVDADAKENDDDAGPAADDEGLEDLGVRGVDLQWGNDFDHPIRDRLPPGFSTALNIVKWWIDPGLDGDAYADSPYLYGPALSSFNALHVGPGVSEVVPPGASAGSKDAGEEAAAAAVAGKKVGLWVEEGGDEAGLQHRRSLGAPDDPKGRMKWANRAENKERWVWEFGREYSVDFFNPYLDFNEFALRLPGFTLPIMRYWDGQSLRYVLRNRRTGDLYLAVTFSLYLKEDVNEDGSLKPGTLEAQKRDGRSRIAKHSGDSEGEEEEPIDEEKAVEEARRKLSGVDFGDETSPDDVD